VGAVGVAPKHKAEKKESEMVTIRTKQFVWAGIITVVLLVGVATVFAFSFGKYEKVKASNGTITVPVAKLSDGKAHFYKFEDNGKEINVLAVKAADGSYKTAFDACDSCYKSKKGYEQQGDKLNCKNCNQKFAINRLGPNASGGCNPGYLPNRQNGGAISIKASDVRDGARYF
jgi:uncharacterized membrane protein